MLETNMKNKNPCSFKFIHQITQRFYLGEPFSNFISEVLFNILFLNERVKLMYSSLNQVH
jgi:hypothetical protein